MKPRKIKIVRLHVPHLDRRHRVELVDGELTAAQLKEARLDGERAVGSPS
jgi:hypothetical protein